MPFNVERGPALIIEKEILRSAAGLDDIKSMVMDSTYVEEYEVDGNPTGRWIVEAGTVLSAIESSARVKPVYDGDTVLTADVVGILGHTREFFLETGLVTASKATDEPIPVLHHGCNFDTDFLVGYSGNETAVASALPTCLFSAAGAATGVDD